MKVFFHSAQYCLVQYYSHGNLTTIATYREVGSTFIEFSSKHGLIVLEAGGDRSWMTIGTENLNVQRAMVAFITMGKAWRWRGGVPSPPAQLVVVIKREVRIKEGVQDVHMHGSA